MPSLVDATVQQSPYAYYDSLRDQRVTFDQRAGFFVCVDYELIREVLRDTTRFHSHGSQTMDGLRQPPDGVIAIRRTMLPTVDTLVTNDPPAHTRVRGMMDNPFRAKAVAALAPAIREIILETLESLIGRGACEFVRDYAVPVPIKVIADQLGVPRSMAHKIKQWSDAAVEPLGMMVSDERLIVCARLTKEFQDYFVEMLETRRQQPRDDLLSHLVHVRDADGRAFSMPEMLSLTSQLLVAGNETTTNAMAAGMRLLVDDPALSHALRVDPGRARTFAEEVLRLESPVQGLFRVVAEDTELAGIRLPRGARLLLSFAGANRDPRKFARANELDLARPNAATHVAFGGGIHHCIGATLAREELVQTFTLWPERVDDLRFAPGKNEFLHNPSLILRGLRALHIEYSARA